MASTPQTTGQRRIIALPCHCIGVIRCFGVPLASERVAQWIQNIENAWNTTVSVYRAVDFLTQESIALILNEPNLKQEGTGAMSGSVPMTREGYNRLKAEVAHLEGVLMPEITEKLAAAREEGDLKENAEYHAQRENQGLLQAKINELKSKIARADIVDVSQLPKDEVVFGCKVTVKDLTYQDEEEFTLVGVGDDDLDAGKILVTSPIGQGLLGKKVGQTAEISVPAGIQKFEVVKIEHPE